MTLNRIVTAAALVAAVMLLAQPRAEASSGATKSVDVTVGSGEQAGERSAVTFRFSQGGYSQVKSRNLAQPRGDPDPSVSHSISEALPGMKVGGKRHVTTPPIAGNPASFDIELLDSAGTPAGLRPTVEFMTEAEKPKPGPDPGTFFKGCTVKRGEPGMSSDEIRGSCVGHVFSDDGLSLPTPCQVNLLNGLWTLYQCNMDGRLIYTANFRTDIGQLADVRYMNTGATYGVTKPGLLGPGTGPAPKIYPVQPLGESAPSVVPAASLPMATNTEADKQYCNGQVQKHLQQGGIPSGVGYVYSSCMGEKLAIANGKLRQAEKDREDAELMQQQMLAHHLDAVTLCPAGAQPPSAASASGATMYGLSVNMPMPCLRYCADEPKTQKGRLCVDDHPLRKTAWGTVRFDVLPNDDVFELFDVLATGTPRVELADGVIVGMTFDHGVGGPGWWLAMLEKKLGRYRASGDAYSWETPATSARLVTETRTRYSAIGQVDLEHPFGEGIGGDDYDAATFSIYVPAVRARREAYEAAEELKNRKEGF